MMFLISILFLAFSCSQDAYLEEELLSSDAPTIMQSDESTSPFVKGKAVVRPFKGYSSGKLYFDAACLKGEGSGNATHLGKFDITIAICQDAPPGGTITAANGDYFKVVFHYDEEGTLHAAITEGTGRFIDAEGEWTVNGPTVPPNELNPVGFFEHETNGWIKY
jgi:hypothetical protein